MATLRSGFGASHACRACTYHGNFFLFQSWRLDQLQLMTGKWINQARRELAHENVVETGLVASNAGVDGGRLLV